MIERSAHGDHEWIRVSNADGVVVVCFKAVATAIRENRFLQLQQELHALVDQEHAGPMILDFENKELPACHVVQSLLLRLHMRLEGRLKVCNLPRMTLWHFEFNGLADCLNIYATREDALAATTS